MLKFLQHFFNKNNIEKPNILLEDNSKNEEQFITIKIYKRCLEKDYPDIEYKLLHLMSENIIFCNNGWWYKDEGIEWKENAISLHVSCNDVFAWGCADSADISYDEIHDLYDLWINDPDFGVIVWCIKKRKQPPQFPIEQEMKNKGYNIQNIIEGKI